MNYEVVLSKSAKKFIDKQPHGKQEQLYKAINGLPDDGDIIPYESRKDSFRLRKGDYRVIFRVDRENRMVYVDDAGNRGQIYNR